MVNNDTGLWPLRVKICQNLEVAPQIDKIYLWQLQCHISYGVQYKLTAHNSFLNNILGRKMQLFGKLRQVNICYKTF